MNTDSKCEKQISYLAARRFPCDDQIAAWQTLPEYDLFKEIIEKELGNKENRLAKWRETPPGTLAQSFRNAVRLDRIYDQFLLNDYWEFNEAASLMLGLDPKTRDSDSFANRTLLSDRKNLISAMYRSDELPNFGRHPSPMDYFRWARLNDVNLNIVLLTKLLDKTAKKSTLNGLVSTVQKEKNRKPTETTGMRERNSLLKLVIGMAVAGYRYDPTAMRSDATGEIAGDLDSLGISMDRDTVLKYLREGAELLPPQGGP